MGRLGGRRGQRHVVALFLLPASLLYLLYVLAPIPLSFYYSLFRWDGLTTARFIGAGNWAELARDAIFWKSLGNNLKLVALSVLIQLPLGLGLALLTTQRGRTRKWAQGALFVPMMLSSVAIGILWKYVYDPNFGLLNGLLEVVGLPGLRRAWLGEPATALYAVIATVSWQYTPLYMLLFSAGLLGIPPELYEAAAIDGATGLQSFLHVTLPMLRATAATALTLAVVGSLKYFDLIYVMTEGGPLYSTEVMATYMYRKAFHEFRMGYGSTVAVAMFLAAAAAAAGILTSGIGPGRKEPR